jgi:hypothetical protein
MAQAKHCPWSEAIYTLGLYTCAGVIAYGLPGENTGYNKVLAHASARDVVSTMDDFVNKVIASGMTITGIFISQPDTTFHDDDTDEDLIQEIIACDAQVKIEAQIDDPPLAADQVTREMIDNWKAGYRSGLVRMNQEVYDACTRSLGALPEMVDILTRNKYTHPPLGWIRASPSPNGELWAENEWKASIPDY